MKQRPWNKAAAPRNICRNTKHQKNRGAAHRNIFHMIYSCCRCRKKTLFLKNNLSTKKHKHHLKPYYLIGQTPDGKTSIEVKLEKETVWLNQYQLEELFETNRTTVNKHIINIYKFGELNEESTCAKIALVQKKGKGAAHRDKRSPETE
jgi:hypothetical protein